ncbi:TPA: DUF2946 domain-containing protein [Pseudomonas aeruginosa]
MSRRYLDYVWVACLAVLFNVFALPLADVMTPQQKRLVMWGGFCSASGVAAQSLAVDLGPAEGDSHPPHSLPGSSHSCHCFNATVLALPPVSFGAFLPHRFTDRHVAALPEAPVAPRRPWPSIVPRASPESA